MFEVPVEDFIFVVCALIGGGLLLITVLLDDILGAVFDFDIGGVSLMPLLLSFISMFGVGGLFATQVLDVHGGQAALVGRRLRARRDGHRLRDLQRPAPGGGPEPFSTRDLIGRDAYVQVGIPAGRYGSVLVKEEGQTHEFSATASTTSRPERRPGDGRRRRGSHRRERSRQPSAAAASTEEGSRMLDGIFDFIGGGRLRRSSSSSSSSS